MDELDTFSTETLTMLQSMITPKKITGDQRDLCFWSINKKQSYYLNGFAI